MQKVTLENLKQEKSLVENQLVLAVQAEDNKLHFVLESKWRLLKNLIEVESHIQSL